MQTILIYLTLPIRREKSLKAISANLFADYDYYNERSGALKMFRHIKENQIFYNTYFKLCYDDSHLISKYDTERAQKEHIGQQP